MSDHIRIPNKGVVPKRQTHQNVQRQVRNHTRLLPRHQTTRVRPNCTRKGIMECSFYHIKCAWLHSRSSLPASRWRGDYFWRTFHSILPSTTPLTSLHHFPTWLPRCRLLNR